MRCQRFVRQIHTPRFATQVSSSSSPRPAASTATCSFLASCNMAGTTSNIAVVCLLLGAAAVALGQDISFYEALKKDPAHKLIVKAIESDKEGTTKQLLNQNVPVTALVPTDGAFIQAGIKYKLGKSIADMQRIMANTCLINAILRQHILPGVYTTDALKNIYMRPSVLVTNKYDMKAKKQVQVNWPLRFKYVTSSNSLTVSSAAMDPKTNKPLINGTIVKPYDVVAGGGIMHNVNQLLLPTVNMTRLLQITGCTMAT